MRLPLLTPRLLVVVARVAAVPCLAGLSATVLLTAGTPALAAALAFLSAIAVLQALPHMRAADLLGLIALFATILEWLHAGLSGGIEIARWQAVVAVTGAMALLLKVQHIRSLARGDAYVPLRRLDRRAHRPHLPGRPLPQRLR